MEVLPKRSRWVWRKDNLFTGSCFLLFGSVRRGYSLTALISLEMQVTARCRWQTRTPVLPKAGVRLLRLILDLQARFSSTTLRGFFTTPKKKDGIKWLTPIGAELQLNQHYSFQRFPKGFFFFFLFIKTTIFLLFRVFSVLRNWMHSLSPLQPLAMWLGRKPDGINYIKSGEVLDAPMEKVVLILKSRTFTDFLWGGCFSRRQGKMWSLWVLVPREVMAMTRPWA